MKEKHFQIDKITSLYRLVKSNMMLIVPIQSILYRHGNRIRTELINLEANTTFEESKQISKC